MKVIHAITAARSLWSGLEFVEKDFKVEVLEPERHDFGVVTVHHGFLSYKSVPADMYGKDITMFSVSEYGLLIHLKEETK